jgi:hypothetical protein
VKFRIRMCVSLVCTFLSAAACSSDSPSGPSGSGDPQISAPALESPADDFLLDTLRPTLTVRNSTSSSGARVYEFQVADNQAFAPMAASRTGVAEGSGGTTSFTPDQELQSSTRMYWRARAVQGSNVSAWSSTGRFRTKLVGFNRAGELYDPLIHGETIGLREGPTTFVAGKGLKIDAETSYLRYQLAQTLPTGEFSVEVEGLYPNGPGQKLKIFSMMDGTGDLISSNYQASVQYRGINGNPDNCISFKAVWGDDDVRLEPDISHRTANIKALSPTQTYLWQANWTPTTFRLLIREGGAGGPVIYDHTITAPANTGPYAPSPHFAYLGANSKVFDTETGSWPGAIYRNVWIGATSRPATLGSALRTR